MERERKKNKIVNRSCGIVTFLVCERQNRTAERQDSLQVIALGKKRKIRKKNNLELFLFVGVDTHIAPKVLYNVKHISIAAHHLRIQKSQ